MSQLLLAGDRTKPIFDSEVISWPEYQKAKKIDLVQAKSPNQILLKLKRELPSEVAREAVEQNISAMLKRMDFPVPVSYDWQAAAQQYYVGARDKDGIGVFCAIDPKRMEVDWFSLTKFELFTVNVSVVPPEAVLKFARDSYLKVFGEPLVGESQFLGNHLDLTHFQNKSVVWSVDVEGVSIGHGSFEIEMNGKMPNRLVCERAPGVAEVEKLKKYLSNHPTKRDAMAIVLKAWKELGKPPLIAPEEKYFMGCQGKRMTHEYGYGKGARSDEIYWIKPGEQQPDEHPYAYEVTIYHGLFQVEAVVDWSTGDILWMHQGTTGW